MKHLAVMVAVYEFERGWGSKIDDYMICLSTEDAEKYTKEFNAENTSKIVPDWYMVAMGAPIPVDLTEKEYKFLKKNKRVWRSTLNTKK